MAPLDQTYSKLMQAHPYGTALYKPQSSRTFHPGSVGYFDAVGNWNPIADLVVNTELPSTPFLPPPSDELILAPEESQTWGPKVGQQTTCRKIDLQQSVSLTMTAGVPVSAGSCFRFENNETSGSVLLVKGPVVHQRYYHEAPFKRWVAANAKAILEARPEVIEYGLWAITSTWVAGEVALNCWSERGRGVDVGFNIGVVQIGELAPKGSWFHAGEADGWINVGGSEGDGNPVVFFGGLKFRYRHMVGGLKHDRRPKQLRSGQISGEETISTLHAAQDGGECEFTCEAILEDETLRPLPPREGDDDDDDEAITW